jgi:anhydro-N-acetylmuramic acid kinase
VSEQHHYVGLISGTSRDGVDAVLLRFDGDRPKVRNTLCLPYSERITTLLDELLQPGRRPPDRALRELDRDIAHHFADATLQLLRAAGLQADAVRAIGSHGQTVWHDPDGPRPESIQLGDAATVAALTGIVTVADFRRADIEAGGQGAPLAPLLHRAVFRPSHGKRVVLNLGGIANISVIDAQGEVAGFDTGPANCLLDAWIRHRRGAAFDRAGTWAATGRIDDAFLRDLLRDAWFARAAPKSTGIEYFNLEWLAEKLRGRDIADRDVQATLAELTARSVADAVRPCDPVDVLLCGGGIHNDDLIGRLARQLPETPLRSTRDFGIDPDWVEAVLFAWLARERLAGRPQDTRSITGARSPVLLGNITHPAGVE